MVWSHIGSPGGFGVRKNGGLRTEIQVGGGMCRAGAVGVARAGGVMGPRRILILKTYSLTNSRAQSLTRVKLSTAAHYGRRLI